jgi:hypothetical protein
LREASQALPFASLKFPPAVTVMAQEPPAQDLMHYEAMAQEALRGVVKAALKRAAAPGGLPGAHHFYITFKTDAPGVSGPPDLLSKYPDEMTIVLQHQYWDLAPGETFFSVTLRFGGQPKWLSIPYAAVRAAAGRYAGRGAGRRGCPAARTRAAVRRAAAQGRLARPVPQEMRPA